MVAPARSGRLLGLTCLGLAAAAGLLWGASALVWFRVTPGGRAPVVFEGARISPSLTGFALIALAGVAAVVATGGVVRRALAALLGLAGVLVAGTAASALFGSPFDSDAPAGSLPQPPAGTAIDALRHQPTDVTLAPLLAVAGGVVLLVVGVLVVVAEPRLSRLGARYAAPGKRAIEIDPDRAAWQDLDAGRDPTVDAGDDPGDGATDGARRGAG